jgi:hypothetical protein
MLPPPARPPSSTNAPKQNPYDIVRLTVPSKNEPDAALEKIKADDKKAAPKLN